MQALENVIKKAMLPLSLMVCSCLSAGTGWYTTIDNKTDATLFARPAGRERWDQYDLDHAPLPVKPHSTMCFYTAQFSQLRHSDGIQGFDLFDYNGATGTETLIDHIELNQNRASTMHNGWPTIEENGVEHTFDFRWLRYKSYGVDCRCEQGDPHNKFVVRPTHIGAEGSDETYKVVVTITVTPGPGM
jgi:hypothetical protein